VLYLLYYQLCRCKRASTGKADALFWLNTMRKEKLIKSPFNSEMDDEIQVEDLRKRLGAEQMLVFFSKGEELHHLTLGFCEHDLRLIARELLDLADEEEFHNPCV
jgi:hypothetical protein